MALGLAAAGVHVLVPTARHEGEIVEGSEAQSRNRHCARCYRRCREGDCERAVQAALRRFGVLHILINHAGCGMRFVNETSWRSRRDSGGRHASMVPDHQHQRQRTVESRRPGRHR